jgi:uncharacterized protein
VQRQSYGNIPAAWLDRKTAGKRLNSTGDYKMVSSSLNNRNLNEEYPVQLSLRVMGEDRDDFAGLIFSLVSEHVQGLLQENLKARSSREGKYVSVTVTFQAQSKAQLKAVYKELSGHKRVLMVL